MSWWPCEDVIGKGTSKDKLFKQVPWKNWAWWRPSVRVKGKNLVLLVWFAETSWCFSCNMFTFNQQKKKNGWLQANILWIYIYTHIYIYMRPLFQSTFSAESDEMRWTDPIHSTILSRSLAPVVGLRRWCRKRGIRHISGWGKGGKTRGRLVKLV